MRATRALWDRPTSCSFRLTIYGNWSFPNPLVNDQPPLCVLSCWLRILVHDATSGQLLISSQPPLGVLERL